MAGPASLTSSTPSSRIFEQEKSKIARKTSAPCTAISQSSSPSSANRSAVDPHSTRRRRRPDRRNGRPRKRRPQWRAEISQCTLHGSTLALLAAATRNESHRDAFIATLRRILNGGIYDHLGGGMARYSVDERWLVPHFEKMLYDNAQMHPPRALGTWHATGEELFRIRIEETIEWLEREMRLPSGAFAASLDADSEGEEGRFYVWTAEEIELRPRRRRTALLAGTMTSRQPATGREDNPQPAPLALSNRRRHGDETCPDAHRACSPNATSRVRPGRDDKALTDWNGLAIRALAEAGRSIRTSRLDQARAGRLTVPLPNRSRVNACRTPFVDQAVQFPGLASDYAAMINAALSLYAATWDTAFVADARARPERCSAGIGLGVDGFSLSASDCRDVILHIRGDQDDATPSATAQIIEAMTRLAMTTGDETMRLRCDRTRGIRHRPLHGQVVRPSRHHQCRRRLAIDPWKLSIVDSQLGIASRSGGESLSRSAPFRRLRNALATRPSRLPAARRPIWTRIGRMAMPRPDLSPASRGTQTRFARFLPAGILAA